MHDLGENDSTVILFQENYFNHFHFLFAIFKSFISSRAIKDWRYFNDIIQNTTNCTACNKEESWHRSSDWNYEANYSLVNGKCINCMNKVFFFCYNVMGFLLSRKVDANSFDNRENFSILRKYIYFFTAMFQCHFEYF